MEREYAYVTAKPKAELRTMELPTYEPRDITTSYYGHMSATDRNALAREVNGAIRQGVSHRG